MIKTFQGIAIVSGIIGLAILGGLAQQWLVDKAGSPTHQSCSVAGCAVPTEGCSIGVQHMGHTADNCIFRCGDFQGQGKYVKFCPNSPVTIIPDTVYVVDTVYTPRIQSFLGLRLGYDTVLIIDTTEHIIPHDCFPNDPWISCADILIETKIDTTKYHWGHCNGLGEDDK